MSFSRVKPSNWSTNEKLTSSQINALDTDHANALDKVNGDTIGSGCIINLDDVDIECNCEGAITSAIDGGIKSSAAGGIKANTAGGIKSAITGGIEAAAARAIRSTADHGISLEGTPNDWVYFGGTTRTGVRLIEAANFFRSIEGFGDMLVKPSIYGNYVEGKSAGESIFGTILLPGGCDLVSVEVQFTPSTSWLAPPSSFPSMTVYKVPMTVGSPLTRSSLLSTVTATYPSEAAGVWSNGNVKNLAYTCDQNNTNATPNSALYVVGLVDSSGGTAAQVVQYRSIRLTVHVSEMRYPF